MSDYGIKVLAVAGFQYHGGDPSGMWLMAYDPDARGGAGEAGFTRNPDLALRFNDPINAWELWRAQSTVMPLRTDGQPNRPLTAYSIAVEVLPS